MKLAIAQCDEQKLVIFSMGSRTGRVKNIHCDWCQSCLKELDELDLDYAKIRDNPGRKHLCIDCWDKFTQIGWCPNCREPLTYIDSTIEGSTTSICSNCDRPIKRIARDLRPVFSRERAILLYYGSIDEAQLINANIWRGVKASYYFCEGKRVPFPSISQLNDDVDKLRDFLQSTTHERYRTMDLQIMERYNQTVHCNRKHLAVIEDKSAEFLRRLKYHVFPDLPLLVSFSGGKDSTVIADLVKRSLGLIELDLVFNNTTLEHVQTLQYISQFAQEHEVQLTESLNASPSCSRGNFLYQAIPKSNFGQIVKDIGPPSRAMRWCCSIFKANGINDIIQAWGKKVLTIYGIRNSESVMRSYYCPVTDQGKIGMQITASPIIGWSDFDIWLYIIKYGLSFNELYSYGFGRVGCWLCPMNSRWSDVLTQLYFPAKYNNWRSFLVNYAKSLGKPDAEEYVKSGNWKKRFGGTGRANSFSGIKFKTCGLRENTMQYNLKRIVEPKEVLEYFKPFGNVDLGQSNQRLGYYLIDVKVYLKKYVDKLMLEAVDGGDVVRVTFIGPKNIDLIRAYVKYQLTKYEVCIQCTACEIACPFGAIQVTPGMDRASGYRIDEDVCWRQQNCVECTWHFESSGCLVAKSLYSYGG